MLKAGFQHQAVAILKWVDDCDLRSLMCTLRAVIWQCENFQVLYSLSCYISYSLMANSEQRDLK